VWFSSSPEKCFDVIETARRCALSSAFSNPAAWFIRSGRGIKPGSRESQSAQTGIAPSALFYFFPSSFAGHDKTL
jgi:hypothetical protein